ncbi:Nonribosomal peptide synthetase [Aspergillus fumigatus]
MNVTTTVASLLRPADVPLLETLILVGEPVTREVVDLWAPLVLMINSYGVAESSIVQTCGAPLRPNGEPSNIGWPLKSRLWVVDSKNHDRLVPIGCVGELLIEGPLLARGYLNDRTKTRASFIEDPAWTRDLGLDKGRRMYKTGDLVRYNPDGTLCYIGRRDKQVKIHGQRVELGEIEHAVQAATPGVRNVAVEITYPMARNGNPTLTAFLEPVRAMDNCDTPCNLVLPMYDSLRAELIKAQAPLAGSLPSYMVPMMYVPLVSFPVNSSGKLDRIQISQLAQNLSESQLAQYALTDVDHQPPSSAMEMRLRQLWAEVLGTPAETIGVHHSFFQAGGDSLAAMKLSALARNQGLPLAVSDIFSHSSLTDMSSSLMNSKDSLLVNEVYRPFCLCTQSTGSAKSNLDDVAAQCNVAISEIEDIYPCTPMQEGLLRTSIRQPGAYFVRRVFRLPTNVNIENFKAAWQTVASLNSIMRTRIVERWNPNSNSELLQVVLRERISWVFGTSLLEYLQTSRETSTSGGNSLCKYALINDEMTGWYFVWSGHHALFDAWSVILLCQQVTASYNEEPLKDPVPFTRFIDYLGKQDNALATSYWQGQLLGEPAASFPQLPSATYEPKARQVAHHIIRRERKPPSGILTTTILRAAWAIVLSKFAGSDNVIFGAVLSGRNAPVIGISDMVAPTITTVPVRIRVLGEETIDKFLNRVQRQATEMMAFEHIGIKNIHRLVPKAQDMLALKHLLLIHPYAKDDELGTLLGAKSEKLIEDEFDSYGMVVECYLHDEQVSIEARFDDHMIPQQVMDHILTSFAHVTTQLEKEGKHMKIHDVALTGKEQIDRIRRWGSEIQPGKASCVHDIIQEQAALHPDAPAICSWDGDLTYGELDALAHRLAHHLATLGIGPEVMVPLCFDKSTWAIVAMLAVLKAGGVFVPLGPSHPVERLKTILQDTSAEVVLASPVHSKTFHGLVNAVIAVDGPTVESLPAADGPACSSVRPNNAAFVIYTSGSTGVPKGVVLEHQALCTSSAAHGSAFGICRQSRVLQFAAYTFDTSVGDIFTTLQRGGCVCVISEYDRMNRLAQVITAMRANYIDLTSSVAGLINPLEVPSITTLILGGEPASGRVIDSWATHAQTYNVYGPTESCINVSRSERLEVGSNPANIGKALASRFWIVERDNHNSLAPIGCIGELLIEGPLLARGYLNDPVKTRESFIEDPSWIRHFGLAKGRRMYKTGDLVRYNPDGTLCYIGRKDKQIKVRGHRVELLEIEHHLAAPAEVKTAAVAYPQQGPLKARLVAVLSLQDHAPSGPASDVSGSIALLQGPAAERAAQQISAIREHMFQRVPDYMVPTVWLAVRSVPLNKSGKLDRVALGEWLESVDDLQYREIINLDLTDEAQIPATAVERQLQRIWSQVLNIPLEQTGLNRPFTSLGGDSITAMQVISLCRSQGLLITVQDVLQAKSLLQLAIKTKLSRVPSNAEESFNHPFGLSPIQRVYFNQIAAKGSSVKGSHRYNQGLCLQLTQHVNSDLVKKAIGALVSQHSMLRARFRRTSDEEWTQSVPSDVSDMQTFQFHRVTEQREIRLIISQSQTNLDIEHGPVFTANLITMQDDERQLLFLVAHHLVIDLVSWRIIMRDLEELLTVRTLSSPRPMSFQTWTQLQIEKSHTSWTPESVLPSTVPPANFEFWGMANREDIYADQITEIAELHAAPTTLLLGTSNNAFQTEPVELMLSALIYSFHQTFPSRDTPAIFNEGHGRSLGIPPLTSPGR